MATSVKTPRRPKPPVSFATEAEVCYLDEGGLLSKTEQFVSRAKNLYLFEKMPLEDMVHDEYSYVHFIEDWKEDEISWMNVKRHHCEAVFDALVDYYMALEKVSRAKLGSKLEKMKPEFMDFIDQEEIFTRFKKFETEVIFFQAIVCGDFETVKFILDIFKHNVFKSKPTTQSGRNWKNRTATRGLKIEPVNFFNQVLLKYYQHVLLNGDNGVPAIEDETVRTEIEFYNYQELRDSDWGGGLEYLEMKWENYFEWLTRPTKVSSDLRENWIDDYFFLIDAGLVRAMLNNITDKATNEKMATKLLDYGVHDVMIKSRLQRNGIDPIFLADKFISCRNRCDAECKRHPGLLFLLLIRLGHVEMVRLCLNHGMSPNLNIANGGISHLKWVDQKAFENFNVDDEIAKLKKKIQGRRSKERVEKRVPKAEDLHADFLNAAYDYVTPLSLALESAFYWKSTSIVELLLNRNANPLTCQDVAIRACTPALTLLSEKKLKPRKSTEVKCLQLINKCVHENYQNIADNHLTLSLLYQSALEKNWKAVEYLTQQIDDPKGNNNKKGVPSQTKTLGSNTNFDEEVFILIVQVFDRFLLDGKRRNGVGYARAIDSIVCLTAIHDLYLDNRRFELLFDILLSAVNADIPGDRDAILRLLENPQMQHYLKLNVDKRWSKRRIDQFVVSKRVKKQFSFEPRRSSIQRIAFRRPSNKLVGGEMRSVQKIEMLCILASKTGFLKMIQFFFDAAAFKPSDQGIVTMATNAAERFDRPLFDKLLEINTSSGDLVGKLYPIVERKDREEAHLRERIQRWIPELEADEMERPLFIQQNILDTLKRKKARMLAEPMPLEFIHDVLHDMLLMPNNNSQMFFSHSESNIIRIAVGALKSGHRQLVDQLFKMEERCDSKSNLIQKVFDEVIKGNNPDALSILLEHVTDAQAVLYVMNGMELKIEHILFNHTFSKKLIDSNEEEDFEDEWYKEDRLFRVAATYLFAHGEERQQRFLATLIEKARSNISDVWFLGLHSLLLIFSSESKLLPLITKDFTDMYYDSLITWMECEDDDKFEDAMHPLVDETLEKVFAVLKDNEHIKELEKKYDDYMTELHEHNEMQKKALREEIQARHSTSSGGSFYSSIKAEFGANKDVSQMF